MTNALRDACLKNQLTKLKTLLKTTSSSIDECTSDGMTPLMICCHRNSPRLVKVLLGHKASTSPVNKLGQTALMMASQDGFLHLVNLLVKAGADMEARDFDGKTALHLAADDLQVEVMQALLKSGANPDSCRANGATPLHTAAGRGRLGVVSTLVCGGADMSASIEDNDVVPLDFAAGEGYEHVVRWMLSHGGLLMCGGKRKGVGALAASAGGGHVGIMQVLTDAGVRDSGEALESAVTLSKADSVRFLLQQYEKFGLDYLNKPCNRSGKMLLTNAIEAYTHDSAPRIMRWLMDAGASTTSLVPMKDKTGRVIMRYTPVEWTYMICEEEISETEGVRRPLLQEQAVRANSWLWDKTEDKPKVGDFSVDGDVGNVTTMRLPRKDKSRVVLRGLFRYCRKTDWVNEGEDEEEDWVW